jgi:hypothetical protein
MLSIQCPCGEQFHAADEHVGRYLKCRRCGKNLLVARPITASSQRVEARRAEAPLPQQAVSAISSNRHLYAVGATVIGLFLLIVATDLRRGMDGEKKDGTTAISTSAPAPKSAPSTVVEPRAIPPTCIPNTLVPATGKELKRGGRGGHGIPTIDNGSGYDAVVALYDQENERVVRRLYVRSGQVGQALSIIPGNYSIRFAFGEAYSVSRGRFCAFHGASEFDHTLEYAEFKTEDGLRYKEAQISLHKVVNGNAPSHGISEDLVFGDPTSQ